MAFLDDITLGHYYPGNSFLHRLDPRSKLLSCLFVTTSLLLVDAVPRLALFVGLGILLWRLSGVPAAAYLKNLKAFLFLFVLAFAVHALQMRWSAAFPFLHVGISSGGVVDGVRYTLRLGLVIHMASVLTMTTTPLALTDGLERLLAPLKRLKVPIHEFALMMMLTLRFVPILTREADRVRNAQLSRGLAIQGGLVRRIKTVTPMVLPLLFSAIRRAEELAVAMEARGYRVGEPRSSFQKLAWTRADSTVLAVAGWLVAGLIWLP